MYSHKHAVENTEFPEGRTKPTKSEPRGRRISPIVIKRVLGELANHANDGTDTPAAKGWAWPANETVAKEAECSVSTAKRVLKFATALGFFEQVVNRQKEQASTRYKFREVIEVDGKEVFRSDLDPDKAWTAPVLPTLVPWEPRPESLGTEGGLAPTGPSLGSCGAKGVVPTETRMVPTELSLSSTGTTNTTNEDYQEDYHLKATTGSRAGEAPAVVRTYQQIKEQMEAEMRRDGCSEGQIAEMKADYEFMASPLVASVLSDGIPRWDKKTLVVEYESAHKNGILIPRSRPEDIVFLHADNIREELSGAEPEDIGCTHSRQTWEDFVRTNSRYLRIPPGWRESDLVECEIEAFRDTAWSDAGLPSEFDIRVAFGEIQRVLGDDEDADDLERKVWARMKEFEQGVFATAFAQAKKVAKTAAPVLVSMPYAKERVDCQSAHA